MLPYVASLLTGILNAIHSGTNAQLTHSLGRPWWSGVIVCVVSGLVILIAAGVTREALPSGASLVATPWWAWLGTALAAVPVLSPLVVAGRPRPAGADAPKPRSVEYRWGSRGKAPCPVFLAFSLCSARRSAACWPRRRAKPRLQLRRPAAVQRADPGECACGRSTPSTTR